MLKYWQTVLPRYLLASLFVLIAITLLANGEETKQTAPKKELPKKWLRGITLKRQLALPVSVSWQKKPLRDALQSLSQSVVDSKGNQLAIVLDRRVDPNQQIDFMLEGKEISLENLLMGIAKRKNLGVCWLGPITYFGPKSITQRLRTVAALRKAETKKLPSKQRLRFVKLKACRWERLTTPRDLLNRLAKENQLTIENIDLLPHDLWSQQELPKLSLTDRLTFILGNFSLTYELLEKGTKIRIVKIPKKVWISLKLTKQQARHQQKILTLLDKLPSVEVKYPGGNMVLQGRAEEIEFISDLLAGRNRTITSVGPRKKTFSITLKENDTLDHAIRFLAKNLQLRLKYDQEAIEKAKISLDQKLPGVYKGKTLADLLQKIIGPVGLAFKNEGGVLEIYPTMK